MSDASAEIVVTCKDIVVEYPQPSVKANTLKEFLLRRMKNEITYTRHRALKGVSLEARRGECVALVGHNGCGKSTLLKVVAGIITPTKGKVSVVGRLAPLIELGAGFDPELTGRENVFLSCSLLGLSQAEIRDRLEEIRLFAGLGDFFDAPVRTYSSGMYMRLGFSCSTAIEPDVLLVDEILAVGDENFQKKCVDRLHSIREAGATVILVSHDLNAVRVLANRALVINEGDTVYEGPPLEAVQFYRELMENARLADLPEQQRMEELRRKRLAINDMHVKDAERPSTGVARVVGTFVTALEDAPTGAARLRSGQRWRLTLEVEVDSPDALPFVVGFAVHNAQHLRLFGGNTKTFAAAGAEALTMPGRHKVAFEFRTLDLASGRYSVVAAIHNATLDQTIDYVPQALTFQVDDARDLDNFDHDVLPVKAMIAGVAIQ